MNSSITITIDKKYHIENKKFQYRVKRIMDIILSIIGIFFLSPIFLIIIITIKLDSKGKAIFKQIRVGKDGKNFTIFKFRTMRVQAESKMELNIDPNFIESFVFQSKSDSRVTKVGNFLRRSSLDELPQLFNVLFGKMSIVGPRPEIPEVVKYYPESYFQRLLVLPGITGLAQISGRGEIELGKTVTYDLNYIVNFSVQLDIKIILLSIVSVFKREGAY